MYLIRHMPLSELNSPLLVEAFDYLQSFHEKLDSLQPSTDHIVWTYYPLQCNLFISRAYHWLCDPTQPHPAFSWTWKTCGQKKHKVFFLVITSWLIQTLGKFYRENHISSQITLELCVWIKLWKPEITSCLATNLLRHAGLTYALILVSKICSLPLLNGSLH